MKHKGFTLIEILVAISVLIIISAVGISTFSKSQLIGRDAKRKQDIRLIAQALELYHQDNKRYPITSLGNNWWQSDNSGQNPWIVNSDPTTISFEKYMPTMPIDPIRGDITYRYRYYSPPFDWGTCKTGQFFILLAFLENGKDPEIFKFKRNGGCGQYPVSNPTAAKNRNYIIIRP